ncbi:Flagellar protein [Sodalis praecaptivus]|uniref:Flagellar secretion chaperone FliS n=1 Tax=Sodalis praecaptivus TaxID=1239307 RepID=W0HPK6_9GAMM|nr:flagellar export chaperone FliS [Sodalis praecaptivus]AHF75754.1 Flagellar protein [Sodalis praecaptivus]
MVKMYGTAAYANVGLQSSVLNASPHQLIVLLFDGAISALIKAEIYLEQNNMVAKGNAISKAINIIDNGLKMALDMEKGNEISRNLAALYDYFIRQLMQANLKKDAVAIKHVRALLTDIADSWKQIPSEQPQPQV